MRFVKEKEVGIYGIYHRDVLVYVGSSVDIANRYSWHKAVLKGHYHSCEPLQKLWIKSQGRGWKFKILERCSKDELLVKEQHYFDTIPTLLNMQRIAGSAKGLKRSLSTIIKMEIAARKRVKDPSYREKLSARVKEQHKKNNFGQNTWRAETIERIENTPVRPRGEW